MNGQYLKTLPTNYLVSLLRNEETKYQYGLINDEYLGSVINLLKERITFLKDVFTFGDYMFQKPQVFEKDYAEKF